MGCGTDLDENSMMVLPPPFIGKGATWEDVTSTQGLQWNKCTDLNCEDSNNTGTVNIFDILVMYIVSYIPKEVPMGKVLPQT